MVKYLQEDAISTYQCTGRASLSSEEVHDTSGSSSTTSIGRNKGLKIRGVLSHVAFFSSLDNEEKEYSLSSQGRK